MSAASEAPAALEAMADARRTGEGFVRVQRITTEQYRVSRVDPTHVVLLGEGRPMPGVLYPSILAIPCSFCGVGPGESCVTASGRRASYAHGDRQGPAYEAYRIGFREGVVDGIRRVLSDWATPTDELLTRHGLVSL